MSGIVTTAPPLSSYLMAAGLSGIVLAVAVYFNYFRLPPLPRKNSIPFWVPLGGFFIYALLSFLILPLLFMAISYGISGDFFAFRSWPRPVIGWLTMGSIFVLFGALTFYLKKLPYCDYILWGTQKRKLCKDVALGAVTWVIAYPIVLLTSLLVGYLSIQIWGYRGIEQVAVRQLRAALGHPALLLCMAIAFAFIIPFLEELLFRGFLQTWLRRHLGRYAALFLTAAIFALVHYSASQGTGNFELIISLFVLALFLGFLYERQGSLWAPFALHATFNGLSILFLLLGS